MVQGVEGDPRRDGMGLSGDRPGGSSRHDVANALLVAGVVFSGVVFAYATGFFPSRGGYTPRIDPRGADPVALLWSANYPSSVLA